MALSLLMLGVGSTAHAQDDGPTDSTASDEPAAGGTPAPVPVPVPAPAPITTAPGPSPGLDGSPLDAPPQADPALAPGPADPTNPADPASLPDPASLGPLPGFTGGGTLTGDNRLPAAPVSAPAPVPTPAAPTSGGAPAGNAIAGGTPDGPVMILAPAAAAPLEAEVAGATGRRDRAANGVADARAAEVRARHVLAGLEAELARTADQLVGAEAVQASARDTLARAAVAWYIGDVQPPNLSAELLDEDVRTVRARKEVSAEAALDQRLAMLDDARRDVAAHQARRTELERRTPAAHGALGASTEAVAAREAELTRTQAELTEAQRRLDQLLLRVDPAVEGLEGAETSGVTFPIAGPFEFLDSWGYPRSGGRRHRGSDVFSPTGTPLVAIEPGVARADADTLGGLVVYLTGDSGTSYYYAHLDSIDPTVTAAGAAGRRVAAGEQVGRVGSTGNAVGGAPQLHIQVAPPGSDWVNPYPLLARLANAVSAARARGVHAAIPGPADIPGASAR